MANDITITVSGKDKTGTLFSGISQRVNSTFAGVRESIQGHMRGAVADAELAGRDIGKAIESGIRDQLGDALAPLQEQTEKQKTRAPRDGEEVGGAFAKGFSAKVESALKALPKLEIDADSTEAETKVAALRKSLVSLSDKTIGVDIDIDQAQGELTAIVEELHSIDGDTATANVRADVGTALTQLALVQAELNRINGQTAHAKVDVDSNSFLSKIKDAVASAASAVVGGLSEAFKTVSEVGGPILTIGILGAVVALTPMIASALGGAITLGLGAGFVGIGAMLLMADAKIKEQFAKTGGEIKAIMTDAAKPLVPVFQTALNSVKDLVKELNPVFQGVFKDAQGPLQDFVKALVGGVKELAPAIQPIMIAFTDLLGVIGPALKGVFKDIGSSLTDLAHAVSENKTVIGAVFVALLQAIPLVISGLGGVVSFFGTMVSATVSFASAIATTFSGAASIVLTFVQNILGGLREVGEAISHIPGMESFGKSMVAGLDTAIAKVGEWKTAAQELGKQVELKASIVDLTLKIDEAKAKLNDPDLTKERRAELTADLTKLSVAKAQAVQQLGDPKLVAEYRSTINSEISKLQSQLGIARKELADPNLTKERKAQLNADIARLQSAVSAAKSALASLHDKTIVINTIYNNSTSANAAIAAKNKWTGGITGAAGGGPRSGLTMVGEQGPELVKLPFGSTVVPAGQTRNMLGQGGGGGQGVTVNVYVQGSIRSDRDLVQIIRNEFLNGGFRGAVTA